MKIFAKGLDFFYVIEYNSKGIYELSSIMGAGPVQRSAVNHVRRGTEQH